MGLSKTPRLFVVVVFMSVFTSRACIMYVLNRHVYIYIHANRCNWDTCPFYANRCDWDMCPFAVFN